MDITPEEVCDAIGAQVRELEELDLNDEAIRLDGLSSMIRDGHLANLAHLDLRALLDPYGVEERSIAYYQRRPNWFGWMEWFRNFLVLVPIALTWFELSRASASYRQTIEDHPDLISQ